MHYPPSHTRYTLHTHHTHTHTHTHTTDETFSSTFFNETITFMDAPSDFSFQALFNYVLVVGVALALSFFGYKQLNPPVRLHVQTTYTKW